MLAQSLSHIRHKKMVFRKTLRAIVLKIKSYPVYRIF